MSDVVACIALNLSIPEERIENMLVSAFEGGIGYWARIVKYRLAEGVEKPANAYSILPLVSGCGVVIDSHDAGDGKTYELNLQTIHSGLHTMATKYPRHFGDFLAENDDAETADVFVQCCVFGEVVYG